MNRDDDLQRLADVISPPPPDLQAWWFTAGAVLILAVAALVIWRLRRRRTPRRDDPRTDAQAQLRTLRGAWEARTIGDRDAAYRLAAVLRLGLGLPQLSESPPPAAADDAALWREAMRQLHQQRYAAVTVQPLPAALFDHARRWLAVGAPP